MITNNARKRLLVGINKTADVVKSTLGYKGKTVLISDPIRLSSQVTKDGVTVAQAVKLEDDIEILGSEMIKAAAQKTLREVGDNTTTTTILTQKMCNEFEKNLDLGFSYQSSVKALKSDEKKFLDYLYEKSKKVENTQDIERIAYVASNNDSKISGIIKDVYDSCGFDVAIDIRESDSDKDSFEVVSGYTMEQTGYVSPIFVNNYEKGRVEYNNPQVFIYNGRIKQITLDMMNILGARNSNKSSDAFGPTVLICEDIDEIPLREIYTAVKQEMLYDVCVVKSNLIYGDRKAVFIDASQVLGAEYTEDKLGIPGSCKKVLIEKDQITFVEGSGDATNHIKTLEEEYDKLENENIFLKNRIFSLKSKAAVINVGGTLSTEISEKVDRVDDAVRAVRSAIEEGYVPGGASVFIHAGNDIDFDTDIMKSAIYECYAQLMKNAGLNDMYYLRDIIQKGFGSGYDLRNNQVVDMLESGIYDSVKGLRVSVQNAVSTALTFGNIEYILN